MLGRNDLQLPDGWPLYVGVDTATFMSAVFVTFCPDPYCALALEEFPNYKYTGTDAELLDMSIPEWARWVVGRYRHYRPGATKVKAWADPNSQFKIELARYDLHLMPNHRKLTLRVEISREYQRIKDPAGVPMTPRLLLAPWLEVLPREMEYARWPEEHTSGGKFEREKVDDHTLDCLEHVLSRRPRTKTILKGRQETFVERFVREHHGIEMRDMLRRRRRIDPHLGAY